MKTVFLPLLLAAPLLCGCGEKNNPEPDNPQEETVVLRLADANATAETKALYSNLWAIREKGWMFGHHDDLMYGRKWYGTEGGSDTKAVCGDYPGVYSLDLSTFMDDRVSSESEENSLRLKCMHGSGGPDPEGRKRHTEEIQPMVGPPGHPRQRT